MPLTEKYNIINKYIHFPTMRPKPPPRSLFMSPQPSSHLPRAVSVVR